jgi:regulator of replication initiation timing|tara:strand:- start:1196 stop:1432 length:237 start_codon:yes stop_codon:yes gene_type:complete
MTKIAENELQELQGLHAEFNKIKSQLGDIALQEHALCLKTEAIRKSFQDLEKGLMEKYGENAVINLETGEVKQKEDNG